MIESEQKKLRRGKYRPTDDVGYYVYCIAETHAAREIAVGTVPTAIEDDANLELVVSNDLAAVVSRVPLSVYDEESLSTHLSDAAWTAVRAMRHEQVVEHFAKSASVIPLRFGTIYLERSRIERMLSDKGKELAEIIHRLHGREEWGVNLYCDRTVLLENIDSVSAPLREMIESAKQASPGQSYLLQKKIEATRADEARAEIGRASEKVESRLRAQSEGVARLRILKVEATEYGELKAKFAFLVRKMGFEEFRVEAENLARETEASGIRLELTGPWPVYNFTDESASELQTRPGDSE
jgi:Gas vesicle synthesis protein GvpL/GvpF